MTPEDITAAVAQNRLAQAVYERVHSGTPASEVQAALQAYLADHPEHFDAARTALLRVWRPA
jgi:hypothetical protein